MNQSRWTCSQPLPDGPYRYRDRYCWIDEPSATVHVQELLVAPHDDFEEVSHRVYSAAQVRQDRELQRLLGAFFGSRMLEELLAACRRLPAEDP